jgi:hypothetical protein
MPGVSSIRLIDNTFAPGFFNRTLTVILAYGVKEHVGTERIVLEKSGDPIPRIPVLECYIIGLAVVSGRNPPRFELESDVRGALNLKRAKDLP